MTEFKPGDRVMVTDPALAQLRAIMANHGPVKPNHHGTVQDDADTSDGSVLIIFDGGGAAPYPVDQVQHLTTEDPLTTHQACSDGDCDFEHGHDGPHGYWTTDGD